jgi:hypothetical protein
VDNDSIAEKKYRALLFPKKNEDYKILQRELMIKVVALNIERLKEITLEHGWQERAWIILWHQRGDYGKDTEVLNVFKPIIDKEIEDGKLSRSFWNIFDQFKARMSYTNRGSFKINSKKEVIKD